MKPPNPANGTECPGIWSCEEVPNLPSLGPIKKHPTSAQVPPSTWTTPDPAKSLYPKSVNQPFESHAQWVTGGYTQPFLKQ